VVAALAPDACLDFPTVTEICETAAQNPDTAAAAIAVLVATLGEQEMKAGDIRNITQDYLKVLTIIHEMLYDDQVTSILRHSQGLEAALERLRGFREGDRGDSTDENIRMLANEIDTKVFRGGSCREEAGRRVSCPKGHLLRWKDGQSIFHVHVRSCALCKSHLHRLTGRYNCQACRYYDICAACGFGDKLQENSRHGLSHSAPVFRTSDHSSIPVARSVTGIPGA